MLILDLSVRFLNMIGLMIIFCMMYVVIKNSKGEREERIII